MTLPPVVSDPTECEARWDATREKRPHVWDLESSAVTFTADTRRMFAARDKYEVCRYCGGRKQRPSHVPAASTPEDEKRLDAVGRMIHADWEDNGEYDAGSGNEDVP